MSQDYFNRSMVGYGVMLICILILSSLSKRYCTFISIIIGNILSFIVSQSFIAKTSNDVPWGGYFKPFGAEQLFVIVSILILIPQVITFILTKNIKK
jgi:hypothetical protein